MRLYTFLLIVLSVTLCRAGLSAYNSAICPEPFVTIKNKRLAQLLIDGNKPGERLRSAPKDRRKLSGLGLVGYCCNVFSLLVLALCMVLEPIACREYTIEVKDIVFTTQLLNEKLPFVTAWVSLCMQLGATMWRCQYTQIASSDSKAMRRFSRIAYWFVMALCVAGAMGAILS